jgi:hypothetical protein
MNKQKEITTKLTKETKRNFEISQTSFVVFVFFMVED